MITDSKPITTTKLITGLVAMAMLVSGLSLSMLPFGMILGFPLTLVGGLVAASAALAIRDPRIGVGRSASGLILILAGVALLMVGLFQVSLTTHSYLLSQFRQTSFVWQDAGKHQYGVHPGDAARIAFSLLAPFLITLGIRMRAILSRSETVCVGLYWLLYFPLTFVGGNVVRMMGLPLTA